MERGNNLDLKMIWAELLLVVRSAAAETENCSEGGVMAEKRKPVFIFLLKKPSKKTMKVELFHKKQFTLCSFGENRYRIRVNGRWFRDKNIKSRYQFFTKYEIRDIMWRSIKKMF